MKLNLCNLKKTCCSACRNVEKMNLMEKRCVGALESEVFPFSNKALEECLRAMQVLKF